MTKGFVVPAPEDMNVSATEPDWSREVPTKRYDPPKRLLRSIRKYQSAGPIARRYWVLSHRFWSVVTGADIPLTCQIGGGLRIPHPNGIVFHSDTVVGPNCTIMQQVTLGTDRTGRAPQVGGHVDIGAGAKIIGGITLGDHAQVGANAVVTKDVPAGKVAVGIPATLRDARPL